MWYAHPPGNSLCIERTQMPVDGEHKGPKRLLKPSHGKYLSITTQVREKYHYYYFIIRKARQCFISLLSHATNFDVFFTFANRRLTLARQNLFVYE